MEKREKESIEFCSQNWVTFKEKVTKRITEMNKIIGITSDLDEPYSLDESKLLTAYDYYNQANVLEMNVRTYYLCGSKVKAITAIESCIYCILKAKEHCFDQTMKELNHLFFEERYGRFSAYGAIVIGRYDLAEKILSNDSTLYYLMKERYEDALIAFQSGKNGVHCEESKELLGMLKALCTDDCSIFEKMLEKRIKDIRKLKGNSTISFDMYALGLVCLAKNRGWNFYCDYIEIPYDIFRRVSKD